MASKAARTLALMAGLTAALPAAAADLGPAWSPPAAGRPYASAYGARFRSPCYEQGATTLLGCLPEVVAEPQAMDADAWNQLSAFSPYQRRPYATLSPWSR